MKEVAVLLHNIRSAHNAGSIFRTCDAAGVTHVYLSGYTPRPIDRFGRPQKDIAKTALGAETSLRWRYVKSPGPLLRAMRKDGWHIVGIEQHARSHDYRALKKGERTLFILGNEVRGISPQMLANCDDIVEIPMHGKKESLNVSVAAGVVLFGTLES
ncbi:MAG: tRNA/rRNA methyltransferase SpoU [Parcubacteria group bacterium Athens0416_74]|nr:MAG: tRNA/rRNA methyltransferase SpoU [Parcubacteria group bacterium Athens0416_74]